MLINSYLLHIHSLSVSQFSRSVMSNPMDCSMPGLPVHHRLPELAQTHIPWVGDAIQPSHSLSSPSPAFKLSQHQGLFKWVHSSHQVAKVLEFQLSINPSDEYSGLISFRMDWLDLRAVQGTLKRLLHKIKLKKKKVFSSTTVQALCPRPPKNVSSCGQFTSCS